MSYRGGDFSFSNVSFGNNVFIGGGAKFLSANAKIIVGKDVMIASNCTIITGNHRIDIIGKKLNEIGNNCMVAGNSFVNFDVPDNSIVLGNPGRIIPKEHATEGYINQQYSLCK